jgi:hypothetical protein
MDEIIYAMTFRNRKTEQRLFAGRSHVFVRSKEFLREHRTGCLDLLA